MTSSYSPPTTSLRPSLRNRTLSLDLEIFAEDFLALDLSRACGSRAGHGDHLPQTTLQYASKGRNAEKLVFCSPHRITEMNEDRSENDDDDDDDDDLQWANMNTRLPLQPALQRSGYGDGKGSYRASNALGKENKVRLHKFASSTSTISRQQHSGPIRLHAGPFSGPLTPCTKQRCVAKPNRVPSIIPVNLLRRKVLGFNACEPMSPEVTCLGRIKNKELDRKSARETTEVDELSVDLQRVKKGRCFDTKNQLCGKRGKGRKKKDKARCLSRRRFASAESKSLSSPVCSEIVQTRRERAAMLARSLTGLLEDMRHIGAHYVPSVPPPNSLLLMRGCRTRNEDIDMDIDSSEHVDLGPQDKPISVPPPNSLLLMRGCRTRNEDMDMDIDSSEHVDLGRQDEPISVPPRNSLLLMRGCKIRGNLPRELLMDRTPMKNKQVQASLSLITPIDNANREAYHVKKLKAREARHLSLLDLIDMGEDIVGEGGSTSKEAHAIVTTQENLASVKHVEMVNKFIEEEPIQKSYRRPAYTLCQRRCFGELPLIEVKLHTKLER